jgi:mannose-6-phosphate isomerase-like protein (cupin superfamily)
MTTKTTPKAQIFDMKTMPVLSDGRLTERLCEAESMTVTGKVYAQGGENALHTHTKQDHSFFVIGGQATFFDEEDTQTVVNPMEGILLPAGAFYWFQSTGDVNLVMVRFSAQIDAAEDKDDDRIKIDGSKFPGKHPDNKGAPAATTGEFFQVAS